MLLKQVILLHSIKQYFIVYKHQQNLKINIIYYITFLIQFLLIIHFRFPDVSTISQLQFTQQCISKTKWIAEGETDHLGKTLLTNYLSTQEKQGYVRESPVMIHPTFQEAKQNAERVVCVCARA